MKIYLATQNAGKVAEFRQTWLAPYINELPSGIIEPDETGDTCEKNAIIKAKYYAEQLQASVISDDSGFFIEELDGYPGVHSARVAKEMGSFEKVFPSIQSRTSSDARAYFETVICYIDSNDLMQTFTGRLSGRLSFPPRGENGFGYDPIFIPNGYEHTLGQLPRQEKIKISHRARALEKFKSYMMSV